MAQKANKDDQVIIRIDMENGIPRVRQVKGKELQRFLKTHRRSKLPTCSLEQLSRLSTELEDLNRGADPKTMSAVSDHFGG